MKQPIKRQARASAYCGFCGAPATEYVPFDRASYYVCLECEAKIEAAKNLPPKPHQPLTGHALAMYEGRD